MHTDDDTLVAEAATNRDAFAALYERYRPAIYNFVLQRVSDPQRAEDITSQVFLRAYQGLANYRTGSFRGWLFQIARNAVIDSHRRERPSAPSDVLDWQADPGPGPSERFERREAREQFHAMIEQLPATQQHIIRMRLGGFTGQEIADALEMSLSAVKSAQYRAFERIRQLMPEQEDDRSRRTGR